MLYPASSSRASEASKGNKEECKKKTYFRDGMCKKVRLTREERKMERKQGKKNKIFLCICYSKRDYYVSEAVSLSIFRCI
jgi:hypothetical protein